MGYLGQIGKIFVGSQFDKGISNKYRFALAVLLISFIDSFVTKY